MKIGDRVFVHGYIDEIRKDTVIVRNDGGYFGTIPSEVITGELPSAQPELSHTQKSCEYCHEDSDGYTRPIEKNCHVYIRFGMNGWELDLKAKGWHGEAQIKFCPMCGRELQGGR